jgi:hypothetical protein
LFFLVATSALTELRAARPEAGCGCFADLSTAPVSGGTLAWSALLAVAALSTVWLHNLRQPDTVGSALRLLVFLGLELLVVGALSPEIGEALIRFGYSEPRELREVPVRRTLATLRRSSQWTYYAALISAEVPADVWRELCWRYVVFQAEYEGQPAEVIFAVFLRRRRPAIHTALVDAVTGSPVAWPALEPLRSEIHPGDKVRPDFSAPAGSARAAEPRADIPFSSPLYGES